MKLTESFLETFIRERAIPGLVVSAFDTDRIDTLSVGRADLETGVPMSPDSLLPIASVTKTFTADLVLRAAARGDLDLDAPIAAQLPGFALADPDASASITPRDALCHFSGLPPHTWAWVYGDRPRLDFIRERLPHLAPAGPFRGKHRYSNLLYAVLGGLLETATGRTWETLLTSELFDPLVLSDIHLLDEDWENAGVCPYRRAGDSPLRIPPFVAKAGHPVAPASELQGSVPCLAAWGRHHLDLDPDDPRWRPHSRVTGDRPHPSMGPLDYGLGWRLDTVNGQRRVWHSGQCGGFSTLLVLHPERRRGLAAGCNLHAAVDALHALDLWEHHGIDPGWSIPKDHTPPRDSEVRHPPSSPMPQPGLYRNPGYGELRVELDQGKTTAAFQIAESTPMELSDGGAPMLYLSEYDVRFPIRVESSERLHIPFEPTVAPIEFIQKNVAEASRR